LAIARYKIDGSLDSSFSDDGKEFNYIEGEVYTLAIQQDEKIVTGGYNNDGFTISRYNISGTLDSSFSNDGISTINFTGAAKSVTIQKDGKIVAVGGGSNAGFAIARINLDGSLDKTFDGDGKQTINFSSGYAAANSVITQTDGRIVVAGFRQTGSDPDYSYDFAIARCNTDGSLDNSFSGDGKQTTDFEGSNDFANSAALQSGGKIVVAGNAFARYNTDGSLNTAFNKNGKLPIETGHPGFTNYTSTKIQKDGKVIAAGYTWNGSNFDFAVARYNTDGSADSTFDSDGKQTTAIGSRDDYINSATIQDDGKIVVTGYAVDSLDKFFIVRYNTDGSLDNTFNDDGKQRQTFILMMKQNQ
jgi:uncharacterized delta-60 repeat protein